MLLNSDCLCSKRETGHGLQRQVTLWGLWPELPFCSEAARCQNSKKHKLWKWVLTAISRSVVSYKSFLIQDCIPFSQLSWDKNSVFHVLEAHRSCCTQMFLPLVLIALRIIMGKIWGPRPYTLILSDTGNLNSLEHLKTCTLCVTQRIWAVWLLQAGADVLEIISEGNSWVVTWEAQLKFWGCWAPAAGTGDRGYRLLQSAGRSSPDCTQWLSHCFLSTLCPSGWKLGASMFPFF